MTVKRTRKRRHTATRSRITNSCKVYLPTPKQIAAACKKIQAEWLEQRDLRGRIQAAHRPDRRREVVAPAEEYLPPVHRIDEESIEIEERETRQPAESDSIVGPVRSQFANRASF